MNVKIHTGSTKDTNKKCDDIKDDKSAHQRKISLLTSNIRSTFGRDVNYQNSRVLFITVVFEEFRIFVWSQISWRWPIRLHHSSRTPTWLWSKSLQKLKQGPWKERAHVLYNFLAFPLDDLVHTSLESREDDISFSIFFCVGSFAARLGFISLSLFRTFARFLPDFT